MTDWETGDRVTVERAWYINTENQDQLNPVVEVTRVLDDGTREYLQGDGSWATTVHQFSTTFDAEEEVHVAELDVPTGEDDYLVTATMYPQHPWLVPVSEDHRVVGATLDDIDAQVSLDVPKLKAKD